MNITIDTTRRIDWLVVHCTATKEGVDVSTEDIRRWHKNKGWSDIGYHFVIDIDGFISHGRDVKRQGAHVKGFNKYSLGIVYVGGLDSEMRPKDTRTEDQKKSLKILLKALKNHFPESEIKGHRDFSKDLNGNGIIEPFEFIKICPCFNAVEEYKNI